MISATSSPTRAKLRRSFNYYYRLDNPESNYPHEQRRGAVDYDDLRARVLDPRSMAMARARIVQAHQEGRRVWLVTEPDIPDDDVPDSDRLPGTLELPVSAQVCRVRAAQLRKQLNILYGTPNAMAVPIPGRAGLELFHVLLYTKNDQSVRTAGGRGSARAFVLPARAEPRPPFDHRGGSDRASPSRIGYPVIASGRDRRGCDVAAIEEKSL
jgi:hypothetical protein